MLTILSPSYFPSQCQPCRRPSSLPFSPFSVKFRIESQAQGYPGGWQPWLQQGSQPAHLVAPWAPFVHPCLEVLEAQQGQGVRASQEALVAQPHLQALW